MELEWSCADAKVDLLNNTCFSDARFKSSNQELYPNTLSLVYQKTFAEKGGRGTRDINRSTLSCFASLHYVFHSAPFADTRPALLSKSLSSKIMEK